MESLENTHHFVLLKILDPPLNPFKIIYIFQKKKGKNDFLLCRIPKSKRHYVAVLRDRNSKCSSDLYCIQSGHNCGHKSSKK